MQPYSELANWDGSLSASDSRSTTEPPPSSASLVNNLFRDMLDPLHTDPTSIPLSLHDQHDQHAHQHAPSLYDLYPKLSQTNQHHQHQQHHHQVLTHLTPLDLTPLIPNPKKNAHICRLIARWWLRHIQHNRNNRFPFDPRPSPLRCRLPLTNHHPLSLRRFSSRTGTDMNMHSDRRRTRSSRRKNARSWPISRSIQTMTRGRGLRARATMPITTTTATRRQRLTSLRE